MLLPLESTTIQPEITVEDDFVDEFREEQQQQLVLSDEQEEGDNTEEVREEEEEEQGEEVAEEQVEDAEVAHEEEVRVVQPSRDTRSAETLTPVSVWSARVCLVLDSVVASSV